MTIVPLGTDVILHSTPDVIQYPILVFEIIRTTYANIFVRLLP
jgi:hypothetical protein